MRSSRLRRGRLAATVLLALAALTTATALAEAPASAGKNARIDASQASVPYGGAITLRGAFPGAADAPIEIQHRPAGRDTWRTVRRSRTGASGRYSVRVRPRGSGNWRAELAASPSTQAAPEGGSPEGDPAAPVDAGTGAERVTVRSHTRTAVVGRHTLAGRTVKVRGTVTPAGAERRVVVGIGGDREVTEAGRDGRFGVAWEAPGTGSYRVRVSAGPNRTASGSRDSAGRVTVYRPAAASWYGPGLYGNKLACGGTLTPSTIGVAHQTMPCGTKLRLRYRDRTVTARVVDRGPYVGNREFDLTSATKQKLGFPDLGTLLTSK